MCAGAPGQVRLWDIEHRRVVSRLAGHGGWVWCMEPHPTLLATLLTGATDGAAPPDCYMLYAPNFVSLRSSHWSPKDKNLVPSNGRWSISSGIWHQ